MPFFMDKIPTGLSQEEAVKKTKKLLEEHGWTLTSDTLEIDGTRVLTAKRLKTPGPSVRITLTHGTECPSCGGRLKSIPHRYDYPYKRRCQIKSCLKVWIVQLFQNEPRQSPSTWLDYQELH